MTTVPENRRNVTDAKDHFPNGLLGMPRGVISSKKRLRLPQDLFLSRTRSPKAATAVPRQEGSLILVGGPFVKDP